MLLEALGVKGLPVPAACRPTHALPTECMPCVVVQMEPLVGFETLTSHLLHGHLANNAEEAMRIACRCNATRASPLARPGTGFRGTCANVYETFRSVVKVPKRQSADGKSADEQSTDLAAGLNGKTNGLRSKMRCSGVVQAAAWRFPKRQSADGQSADEQSTDLAGGLNGKTHGLRQKMRCAGVVQAAAWQVPQRQSADG